MTALNNFTKKQTIPSTQKKNIAKRLYSNPVPKNKISVKYRDTTTGFLVKLSFTIKIFYTFCTLKEPITVHNAKKVHSTQLVHLTRHRKRTSYH